MRVQDHQVSRTTTLVFDTVTTTWVMVMVPMNFLHLPVINPAQMELALLTPSVHRLNVISPTLKITVHCPMNTIALILQRII